MNWGALIALAVAFGCGWGVNGWRLDATYQAEQTTRLTAAIEARDKAIEDRDALALKLTKSNDAHAFELRKAQNETNRIRDGVSVGTIGLRVAATCPGTPTTEAAPGAVVDHGTGPELAGNARQDYFALRDGIDRVVEQLGACQDELRLRVDAPGQP